MIGLEYDVQHERWLDFAHVYDDLSAYAFDMQEKHALDVHTLMNNR